MEIYDNERDQVEALKRFLQDYGKAIAALIVLVIAAVIGWHYWTHNSAKTIRANSLAYDNVTESLTTGGEAAEKAAAQFVVEQKNTYGALAALTLARQLIDQQQFDKARTQLQQALANTRDDNLKALISLRLARVQIQQQQPDAALNTLNAVTLDGFSALVNDLRGDALLSKGEKQAARKAWEQSLQSDASGALRDLLHMKIDNLSA